MNIIVFLSNLWPYIILLLYCVYWTETNSKYLADWIIVHCDNLNQPSVKLTSQWYPSKIHLTILDKLKKWWFGLFMHFSLAKLHLATLIGLISAEIVYTLYFSSFNYILWNAVTSLGENKVILHPLPHTPFCETQWRHSVKTRLYKNPPPYFIVLASSVKTKEVEVIEFHRIQ